jgi:hypothetical protein
MNSFALCIAFNFLLSQGSIYVKDSALKTMCSNAKTVIVESQRFDIDPFVLTSLIYHESRWQRDATGPTGDCGLAQNLHKYIPNTTCKDLHNPKVGIHHGAKFLSAFKTYLKRNSKPHSPKDYLKCYPSGYRCACTRCNQYSRKVMNLANKIKEKYTKIVFILNLKET